MKPDISEYYIGERAVAEERAWGQSKIYLGNAAAVRAITHLTNIHSILELGCGSGWVASQLPDHIPYVGVDNNPTFLDWAIKRNQLSPHKTFIQLDLRRVEKTFDLVCSFAVLKHFGFHEWDDRLRHLLSLAPWAVFDVQLTDRDIDNGTDYHHVFVTPDHLRSVVGETKHRIIGETVTAEGPVEGGTHGTTVLVVTHQ